MIFIRIWILGSLHRTADPDPSLFGRGFQDANKKYVFFKFFGLFLAVNKYNNISLQSYCHWKITKQKKSWFIFIFLLVDGRIRILEAQKHMDPDPEHWIKRLKYSQSQTLPFASYLHVTNTSLMCWIFTLGTGFPVHSTYCYITGIFFGSVLNFTSINTVPYRYCVS